MDKRTLRRFPLDVSDVVSLYNVGTPTPSIANKYGCSQAAVVNCLKREGVYAGRDWKSYMLRNYGVTPEDLLEMYRSGMWKNEIAAKTGISEGAVGKYLSYLGVPIAKDRSESVRKRYKRMSPEQRDELTKSAHDAVRGIKRTKDDLCKRAIGKERSGKFGSVAEKELFYLLKERGVVPIPQKALWIYNIDLSIGNIAVEMTGRARKPDYIPIYKERIKYILNRGFILVYVWANTVFPVEAGAADYIVSLVQQASSDPSLVGQYRVIRRDGELLTAGGFQDDQFAGIFAPVNGTFGKTGN